MPENAWHAISTGDAVEKLGTNLEVGLSTAEAEKRLSEYGPNVLPEAPPIPFWERLLAQLKSFVVLILLAATVISMALGDWIEAGAILAIVFLNAFIGAIQESKAEKALQSLKKMAAPEAQVVRDGTRISIPTAGLVPGDVVLLEAGSLVPADLRLVETAQLRVDESSLTGESAPVEKRAEVVLEPDTPLADRLNSAFMGTTVVYGRGKAVVVGTGTKTELGKIAKVIEEKEEKTPLQRKLDEFGKILGTTILIICAVVLILEMVRDPHIEVLFQEGIGAYFRVARTTILSFFVLAAALAVAAVPEGLPAIVTVCLALGMREMLKRHALVRRLPSVETLGSATVICADKTGTITQNQMTVTRIWTGGETYEVTGHGYEPSGEFFTNGQKADPSRHPLLYQLLWAGLLCNDAELSRASSYKVIGDPTEGALVVAAAKAGMDQDMRTTFPRAYEFPFDSERKRMTTIHPVLDQTPIVTDGRYLALVKGAPDVVLSLCSRIQLGKEPIPLDDKKRQEVLTVNEAMAEQGLRILAVAYRPLSRIPEGEKPEDVERELVFLGLLGMQDLPRVEVPDAVARARRAGLRTIMITGDHIATAEAIAKQIGIIRPEGKVISGKELDRMSDDELKAVIEDVDVFARVSPHHKVRIVDALRARGHVVAMTGDGVNDAPALKRADIGIAMGISGTDVAKETSDMVLTDDNYASIVAAVEQGRIIYANIRKTVYYLLSCNFAEIAIIFLATLIGWPAPLTAIQLLWLNLLSDGAPALALGVEPGEPGIMDRPPRSPKGGIINREMATGIAVQASAITTAVLLVYFLGLRGPWAAFADTMSFTTLVLAELWRAYTARSERVPLIRIGAFTNHWMQWAVVVSMILLLLVIYAPFLNPVFETQPLDWRVWLLIFPFAFVPALVVEAGKFLFLSRERT